MEFYTSKVHVAKKDYKCQLCHQEIKAGENYTRESGKYEGEFFDRCLHISCSNIIADFCHDQEDNEYTRDWIAEWLVELYCESCEKECGFEQVLKCEVIAQQFDGEEA